MKVFTSKGNKQWYEPNGTTTARKVKRVVASKQRKEEKLERKRSKSSTTRITRC
jgi:hypothetical protein